MKLAPPKNPNYSAVVVRLSAVNPLAGCDNIVGAPALGFQAIVSKDTQPGTVGIVFTAETQLSDEYARVNNLHRDATLNADPEANGYLEANRRVRAIKLRGHRSDALFMPLTSLAYTGINPDDLNVGDTFDTLNAHEVCRKYEIVKAGPSFIEKNKTKAASRVYGLHFREHFDTDNYFKVRDNIPADADIVVTAKWHGSSFRMGNTLVQRPLSRLERLAKRFGVRVQETEYAHVVGSRRVIMDFNDPKADLSKPNLWTEMGARLGDILPEGVTIYGEIIGWNVNGSAIQREYTYGILEGVAELYVYRASFTNPQGRSIDLGWDQVVELCRDLGLKTVPVLWRGVHDDFDPDQFLDIRFLDAGYEEALPLGPNKKLVDEGVVVRVEGLSPHFSKAKSPIFRQYETRELDKGEVDIESLGAAA